MSSDDKEKHLKRRRSGDQSRKLVELSKHNQQDMKVRIEVDGFQFTL